MFRKLETIKESTSGTARLPLKTSKATNAVKTTLTVKPSVPAVKSTVKAATPLIKSKVQNENHIIDKATSCYTPVVNRAISCLAENQLSNSTKLPRMTPKISHIVRKTEALNLKPLNSSSKVEVASTTTKVPASSNPLPKKTPLTQSVRPATSVSIVRTPFNSSTSTKSSILPKSASATINRTRPLVTPKAQPVASSLTTPKVAVKSTQLAAKTTTSAVSLKTNLSTSILPISKATPALSTAQTSSFTNFADFSNFSAMMSLINNPYNFTQSSCLPTTNFINFINFGGPCQFTAGSKPTSATKAATTSMTVSNTESSFDRRKHYDCTKRIEMPRTYKPHTGKLKPLERFTVKQSRSAVKEEVLARGKNKRNLKLDSHRNIY